MEFENNGLKNSIAGTLRLVGILISGAWSDKYKQPKFIENAAQEDFYQTLLQRIDRGEINEAENELLAYMEGKRSVEKAALQDIGTVDNTILDMAFSVYGYMNEKEDIFLEQNNYCRQEIEEGIRGLLMRFGVSIPADSWF
ncbi:DUF6483 family protein [Jutongia sp.]|uniref:DUF6483 family protein n=1 Tax=Jutongia sp. TaxID=2944204 RepID=UPI00307A3E3A